MAKLLEVKDLKTQFHLRNRTVYAVNGVSFSLDQGKVIGIVGESGSGKSVTSLSIMRLIRKPGRIEGGEVLLHDNGNSRDLLKLSDDEMRKVRGDAISMIFQDPMTSLNPVLTVGYQLMEPLNEHRGMDKAQSRRAAIDLLDRVGIPEPEGRMKEYPHQFSGGMRQRVMIAMALACTPRLLIADEPTTALDVTIQAQILDLIRDLRKELNASVIIITHNLGVIAELADDVAVMYAGLVAEQAPVQEIFDAPKHPYTKALIASIPRLRDWPERLANISGAPPRLLQPVKGCPFEPRCSYRIARCSEETPALMELGVGHTVACWVSQAHGGLPNG